MVPDVLEILKFSGEVPKSVVNFDCNLVGLVQA